MKKQLISEVQKLQKIAGILKEAEDFDLSDNPLQGNPSFENVVNSDIFTSIMDGGHWNYDRFGFGEVNGKCYMVELEGENSDSDVYPLKRGLTVKDILDQGQQKGFFDIQNRNVFYEEDLEDEMNEWIESLKA